MNSLAVQIEQVAGKAPDLMGEIDVSVLGYEEAEFLVTGIAASFDLQGERGTDGEWAVAPRVGAEFCTRVLVRRPTDPQRFSGTVVVEWNNVSGAIDASPEFPDMLETVAMARELDGFAAQCDAQLSINVMSDGAPWSANYVLRAKPCWRTSRH